MTVKSVQYSEADLRAIHDRVSASAHKAGWSLAGVPLGSIEDDVINNTVVVNAVRASAIQLASIEERFGPGISARSVDEAPFQAACVRTNCPNPLKAGLNLYQAGTSACMSSFVFRSTSTPYVYWLSTAGHCSTIGANRQHPTGASIGYIQFKKSSDQVDAALIAISSSQASNKMYGNTGIFTITSREVASSAVIGQFVCSSRNSGQTCGSLTTKNANLGYVDGQFGATGQYARGGDSGSPVYYGSKAMGIMAAASCEGCSLSYYTPIQYVEIWTGFRAVTAPPS